MSMKKKLAPVLAAALALTLAACGDDNGDSENGGGDAAGGETTLVLGHEGSESDPRQDAALQLKEIVEEETDGRITIDIHANGTLGNWEDMIEGLQFGSTDIVIESLLTLESYTNFASIETAPFLYRDVDHFTQVWEGEIGDEIRDAVAEDTGFTIAGNMFRGARQLTTVTPVTSLDDLSGLTIRTPSTPTMVQTWDALGARAEAMPWDEVYSALEQGVLDGQENPLSSILFGSIHEVAPEVTMTEHVFANFHFIMWEDTLDGLSEEDRQIVIDAAQKVGEDYTAKIQEEEANYRAQMEEQGATFHELTDRDAWVEATAPIIESLPERVQGWAEQIAALN